MRKTLLILSANVLFFVGGGCGDSSAPAIPIQSQVGPHRGVEIPLATEPPGYIEVVNEPEVEARSRDSKTAVAVYFFASDGKTPLAETPTQVSFRVDLPGGRTENLPLKSEPKSSDPSGSNRFTSPLGSYSLDTIRGTLSFDLKGKKVEHRFTGGR